VGEHLGLQAKLADGLAILARLLRGCRRGELDAVDAKVIEGPGNFDLGLGVKEGICKLLSLCVSKERESAYAPVYFKEKKELGTHLGECSR
jgi:hypothetical protein